MKYNPEPSAEPLRALLRAARPDPSLPPRFQEAVWRRIASAASPPRGAGAVSAWLDRAAACLWRPRLALTGLAVLLVVGTSIGVLQGTALADELAKQRYLTSVSPLDTRSW